jgi:hypothetical protein
VDADGERTASAESVEGGAFGFDGEAGGWVFEEGDGVADPGVAGLVRLLGGGVAGAAGFEREGSLAGGGANLFGGEAVVDGLGAVEAVEAGGGEDEGVALALL